MLQTRKTLKMSSAYTKSEYMSVIFISSSSRPSTLGWNTVLLSSLRACNIYILIYIYIRTYIQLCMNMYFIHQCSKIQCHSRVLGGLNSVHHLQACSKIMCIQQYLHLFPCENIFKIKFNSCSRDEVCKSFCQNSGVTGSSCYEWE